MRGHVIVITHLDVHIIASRLNRARYNLNRQ
jgi:hypothetical protein